MRNISVLNILNILLKTIDTMGVNFINCIMVSFARGRYCILVSDFYLVLHSL